MGKVVKENLGRSNKNLGKLLEVEVIVGEEGG